MSNNNEANNSRIYCTYTLLNQLQKYNSYAWSPLPHTYNNIHSSAYKLQHIPQIHDKLNLLCIAHENWKKIATTQTMYIAIPY